MSPATDAGHATEGAVEEDLTDDGSTKDPSCVTGRQDIDSGDSNPPKNIMPTNDTDQSNIDVSELFKTPKLPGAVGRFFGPIREGRRSRPPRVSQLWVK